MDLAALEAQAEKALDPQAWEYIARGAGDDVTREANVAAWRALRLRPHVLHDVSKVDATTTVLGTEVRAPVLVAPTAMHRFCCDEGEVATARAAATAGTVMCVSMAATRSLEDVAAAAPEAPRWLQLYMLRDRGRTRALCERARDAGYDAIVASVDGGAVPYGHGDALAPPADFRFPNLAVSADDSDLMGMVAEFDTTVTFDDVALLREWSGLPVVVKGVLRGDDAWRCLQAGAAALSISNHGGRTVDGCVATADALRDVVDTIQGGRPEVYVDGGVRSGTDVVKALALGAQAVMVGRPVLWGLAVGGADGAAAVLDELAHDVVRAMAFCGVSTVGEITPDLVA